MSRFSNFWQRKQNWHVGVSELENLKLAEFAEPHAIAVLSSTS
jgi:hypothetical protein